MCDHRRRGESVRILRAFVLVKDRVVSYTFRVLEVPRRNGFQAIWTFLCSMLHSLNKTSNLLAKNWRKACVVCVQLALINKPKILYLNSFFVWFQLPDPSTTLYMNFNAAATIKRQKWRKKLGSAHIVVHTYVVYGEGVIKPVGYYKIDIHRTTYLHSNHGRFCWYL